MAKNPSRHTRADPDQVSSSGQDGDRDQAGPAVSDYSAAIQSRKPKSRRSAIRVVIVLIVVGLAVHLLLPQLTTIEHSLAVLRSMKWWLAGLAAVAQVMSYMGSGYLLQSLARLSGVRLPLFRCVMITTAATSLGLVWGGQLTNAASIYRWMRSSGTPPQMALLSGWLPSLLNDVILIAISVFGLVYLFVLHELSRSISIAFFLIIGILLLVTALLIWGAQNKARITKLLHGAGRRWAKIRRRAYDPKAIAEHVEELYDASTNLRHGGWRGPLLGGVANIVFDALTLYLLFLAAGVAIGPGVLMAGYGLPILLSRFTFLPGGIGIIEGGMAAIYKVLAVPSAPLVLVILTYRLLSFWIPLVLGFPFAIQLNRRQASHRAYGQEKGDPAKSSRHFGIS